MLKDLADQRVKSVKKWLMTRMLPFATHYTDTSFKLFAPCRSIFRFQAIQQGSFQEAAPVLDYLHSHNGHYLAH